MFCGLLNTKLAILDYKNSDLKKSKILPFSEGVSQCFLAKIGNCVLFFSKIGQRKVFCGPLAGTAQREGLGGL